MPLSKKGSKILASMTKTYGDADKAKRVMYASVNAGRISGVDPTFEKRMDRRKKKGGD
jgi:hypothetical protein